MRSAGAAIRERRNSAAEVSSRQLRHRVDQVNNEPQVRVARARATRPLIAVLNALLLIAVVVIPLRALLGLGGSGQRKNLVRSGSLLGTEWRPQFETDCCIFQWDSQGPFLFGFHPIPFFCLVSPVKMTPR